MYCNICLESGNLISPCSCSLKTHEECIKLWHKISYGKVIKLRNLCCPQCKTPGKAKFMNVFNDDKEVINMLKTLGENKDWTHILCPSCRELKKYMQESCSTYIDDTYRLVCNDCSPKSHKECPNCGILIEKAEGCLHMTCNCGTHFCWLCLEIHTRGNIYKHIDDKHKNIIEDQIRYENYLYRLENNDLELNQVPEECWTKELILKAVKRNYKNFKFVKNPSRELYLEAVKENGLALEYVKEQDKEICLEAIKRHGSALEYVKEQDRELCLKAVKNYGPALEYVEEQDKEICLEAVKQKGRALEYVRNQDREICLNAVKKNGSALQYVRKQDKEICLEAVKQDRNALKYVNNELKDEIKELLKID